MKKTQDVLEKFKEKLIREVCSENPNSFWHRNKHEIELPYVPNFSEKNILTKAMLIQTNQELLTYCKREIQDLLDKKIQIPLELFNLLCLETGRTRNGNT